MKEWWNRGIATHINTDTRWGEQSASHPAALHTGKGHLVPTE